MMIVPAHSPTEGGRGALISANAHESITHGSFVTFVPYRAISRRLTLTTHATPNRRDRCRLPRRSPQPRRRPPRRRLRPRRPSLKSPAKKAPAKKSAAKKSAGKKEEKVKRALAYNLFMKSELAKVKKVRETRRVARTLLCRIVALPVHAHASAPRASQESRRPP